MVPVKEVVLKYQDLLKEKVLMRISSNRLILGKNGVGSRLFYMELFRNRELFMDFLREVGLIKSNNICEKCGKNMKLLKKNVSDGVAWKCLNYVTEKTTFKRKKCGAERSFRFGSWFSLSKLTLDEIILITYEIVKGTRTGDISEEYAFTSAACADWRRFVNHTILEYIQENSKKVAVSKVIEVDKALSLFNRECSVQEEDVFNKFLSIVREINWEKRKAKSL